LKISVLYQRNLPDQNQPKFETSVKKLLLILVLSPLVSIAQHIKGIVVSKKNNLPVENTNVLSLSGKIGTVTDENGTFSLKLLPQFKENEILEFSHIGFTTLKISIEDLKKTNFKISLSEEIENLNGLMITSNKKIKLKAKQLIKNYS